MVDKAHGKIVHTSKLFNGVSWNYEDLCQRDEAVFAGWEYYATCGRQLVSPYGLGSVGLCAYGGFIDSGKPKPLYAHQLRISFRNNLVRAGRRFNLGIDQGEPEELHGRWLYAGELMDHFGHFMAECSHRLYPATEYFKEHVEDRGYEGVIFSARNPMKSFHRDLIVKYYGIPEHLIRLVSERPVLVEELDFVPQGSILGKTDLSSDYIDFLSHHQEKNQQVPEPHSALGSLSRIFIPRRHLETGGGGVVNEQEISEYLQSLGFVEFKPEEHSLTSQLRIMSQAERIVAVGGSFAHLFDHLGKLPCSVFMMSRADRDSVYHPWSVETKARDLVYYQPELSQGDSVIRETESGRDRSEVRYDIQRLFAGLHAWLNEE